MLFVINAVLNNELKSHDVLMSKINNKNMYMYVKNGCTDKEISLAIIILNLFLAPLKAFVH